MVKSGLLLRTVPNDPAAVLAETGWRYVEEVQPDGTTKNIRVPLTSMEFLHPQEGYHLPNSTFHEDVIIDARDMLTRRYGKDPTVAIFSDLLILWDMPDLDRHCPDLFVVVGINNKQQYRTSFVVADEGVRPAFAMEVVSPRYRKEDRQIKVWEYEQAGIQEYVIIDRRTQRGQVIDEVLGYRLVAGRYLSLIPDDDGRIPCETIGLWVSMQDGRLLLEDMQTAERLLTSQAKSQELEAENLELKAKSQEWEAQKQELSAENLELKTRLRKLEAQQEGRQSS